MISICCLNFPFVATSGNTSPYCIQNTICGRFAGLKLKSHDFDVQKSSPEGTVIIGCGNRIATIHIGIATFVNGWWLNLHLRLHLFAGYTKQSDSVVEFMDHCYNSWETGQKQGESRGFFHTWPLFDMPEFIEYQECWECKPTMVVENSLFDEEWT